MRTKEQIIGDIVDGIMDRTDVQEWTNSRAGQNLEHVLGKDTEIPEDLDHPINQLFQAFQAAAYNELARGILNQMCG